MASVSDADDELRRANLRLCRLCIWRNYDGFGCELEASTRPPHLVRLVKSNSPAAACGLKIRDVVLAVNQQDVSNASYNQVRNAIKAARDSKSYVEILVVEQHVYRELKKKKVRIDSTCATIFDTPPKMPQDYLNFPKNRPRTCNVHLSVFNSQFGFEVVNGEKDIGAYIQEVLPNTPASQTSLRKSDRIIEIDDKFVDKDISQSIIDKLDLAKAKGAVKLYVLDTDTYKHYQTNKIPLAPKKERKAQLVEELISINQQSTHEVELDAIDVDSSDDTDDEYFEGVTLDSIHIRPFTLTQEKTTSDIQRSSSLTINVCKGDLITQHTDVIVVCSSSQYLFDSICKAGGDTVSSSYNTEIKKKSKDSIIAVQAAGQLASKRIYFLPWTANSDESILQKSIGQFVSDAIEKAVEESYRSIAFPAIGCGKFGCSISLVAKAMVGEAQRKCQVYNISTSFVIQPERTDIYDEFQKQINLIQPQSSSDKRQTISTTVGKGRIEVEQGDITMQEVDVIIDSSSSSFLRKAVMKAAGDEVQTAYEVELKNHPDSILIATPPGLLSCKQIFFVQWEPDSDDDILGQSLANMISIVVQNAIAHQFTSIAFPAIGCGQHGCSIRVIVKTMVLEIKKRLINQKLPWTIKFVIQPDQQDVYDEFCKQVVTTDDGVTESPIYKLPPTWEKSTAHKIRLILSPTTDEYAKVTSSFHQVMKEKYTQIVRIERIQNERWYMQYLAHYADFKRRLNMDTEKRLYHGCPQQAANSIIEDGFNRSFAGVNGTLYGIGVYFSSNAVYSHGYATANANEERCMFVARVLVGKTIKGNSSMKTRPLGFDSTTDCDHIFVTYHDAQAYAEYLITYK